MARGKQDLSWPGSSGLKNLLPARPDTSDFNKCSGRNCQKFESVDTLNNQDNSHTIQFFEIHCNGRDGRGLAICGTGNNNGNVASENENKRGTC